MDGEDGLNAEFGCFNLDGLKRLLNEVEDSLLLVLGKRQGRLHEDCGVTGCFDPQAEAGGCGHDMCRRQVGFDSDRHAGGVDIADGLEIGNPLGQLLGKTLSQGGRVFKQIEICCRL